MSVNVEETPQHAQDADDIADLSDEEGDALFPNKHSNVTSVRPLKPKHYDAVRNITLFLCPYLFGVIFIVLLFLLYCFVLSGPIMTVLNAFPKADSLLLDLTNITKALNVQRDVSFAAIDDYQYNFSNYLFKIHSFESSSCGGAKFYVCDDTLRHSSVKSYSIGSTHFPCVAFLTTVDNQPSSELEYLTKISDAPQVQVESPSYFYGFKFLKNTNHRLCSLTLSGYNSTQVVPTSGLYTANQSDNISLPHYEFDSVACHPTDSIHPHSKLLIIADDVSACKLVIYGYLEFHWALSAICLIFVFLIGCDVSYWVCRKYFKKYE